MTFTRRTYRVAIARSIRKEGKLRAVARVAAYQPMRVWFASFTAYQAQINRTRRLQQRKRRERK